MENKSDERKFGEAIDAAILPPTYSVGKFSHQPSNDEWGNVQAAVYSAIPPIDLITVETGFNDVIINQCTGTDDANSSILVISTGPERGQILCKGNKLHILTMFAIAMDKGEGRLFEILSDFIKVHENRDQ